jgi:hypothetical protein
VEPAEAALLPQPNSRFEDDLKNASGGQSLNGTNANHVPQACSCKHACVAHSTKKGGAWKLDSNVLMLNGGFANPDGDDIADHHYKSNLG